MGTQENNGKKPEATKRNVVTKRYREGFNGSQILRGGGEARETELFFNLSKLTPLHHPTNKGKEDKPVVLCIELNPHIIGCCVTVLLSLLLYIF